MTIDDQTDDIDYHKRIRIHIKEPSQKADDRYFTSAEVKNAIEDLKDKKTPGESGITGVINQMVYKLFHACFMMRNRLWNIQYNSPHNIKYVKQTKALAFADDLLIAVRAENVQEAENFANIEKSKISNWAKEIKIAFN
jgi:hypothetical protein